MGKPVCSVVLSTYNRGNLLYRSLACYARQEFPKNLFELVVIDDSSDDHTAKMCRQWSHTTGIKLVYVAPYPKPESWRDCGAILNTGIRVSTGRHIILTHPEILVGRTSVLDCVNALEAAERTHFNLESPVGLYACCRTYYLSPREQVLIDTVDWLGKGPLAVRDIEGFYEEDTNGHPDFSHRATDIVAQPGSRLPKWESFIFAGHSRETWKRLGGLIPSSKWGSVDVGWMARRNALNIPNYTCPNESAIVCHMNHDLPGDVVTPRIENVWKEELSKMNFNDPNKLVWPAVNELDWT